MNRLRHRWFLFLLFLPGLIFPGRVLSWTPKDSLKVKDLLNEVLKIQDSDPESAMQLAREAFGISGKISYGKGIAGASMRLGTLYHLRGENDSALACFRRAYLIRKSRNEYKGATGAGIMMSYAFSKLGRKDSAFAILYESLRLNRFTGDSSNLANIYVSLGNLSVDYNDLNAALNYFLKAEAIAQATGDNKNLSLAYGGLGHYYFANGYYRGALSYFINKETLDRAAGSPYALAQAKCNIALCYDALNDFNRASGYYHEVINEYRDLEMISDEAHVYYNIGRMFINRAMPDSAIFYLEKALKISEATDDPVRESESCDALADAFELKKEFRKAFYYHRQYVHLNDSLLDREKIMSIAEMQTKYEMEKKEQEIRLLETQNEARRIQRNFLIAAAVLVILLAISIFIGLMKTSRERKRSDSLLLNILPSAVAEELKTTGASDAKYFEEVTVMFTDFKGFTTLSENLEAKELVSTLHNIFTAFDKIIDRHNLEKIKTIGDSYLCAGGLPVPNSTHPQDVVNAALEIRQFMMIHAGEMQAAGKPWFEIRIGIHTGPVVAGIVGIDKFAYDIWGDTVNTASHIEKSSETGCINISAATYEKIKDRYTCTYRGKIAAKNKGKIDMYFVEGS